MRFLLIFLLLVFSVHAEFGFKSTVTTLAIANTAQTLTTVEIRSYDFFIQNPASNTVSIFIGNANVTTSGVNQGVELVPGQSISISTLGGLLSSAKIFIVSNGTSIPVTIGRTSK